MDLIKVVSLVCAVGGSLSVTGCVSIHNENQGAPAKEEADVILAPDLQESPRQTESRARSEPMARMVVLEQASACDAASRPVDILMDVKKPCSSVADDASNFKK